MRKTLFVMLISFIMSCGGVVPTEPLQAPVCIPDEEPVTIFTEKCDGRDNDCDGLVDLAPCWRGGQPGLRRCVNGKWEALCVCGALPRYPIEECVGT